MKKIKLGFTLAEVATAMAIVGVIAASVVPMLTKNIQQQKSGAILGKAVEQIVTGNQNLIQFVNSNATDEYGEFYASYTSYTDVLSTTSDDNGVSSVLSSLSTKIPAYWGVKSDDSALTAVKSFNGGNNSDDNTKISGGKRFVFTKFPASIALTGSMAPGITKVLDPKKHTGYYVYIDTNGWNKKPNRAGFDIFLFKLLNDGSLIPDDGPSEVAKKTAQVVKQGFRVKYD